MHMTTDNDEENAGMHVLGIMGSPRVGGNSDVLLDHALKGAAEAGASTDKIILNELLINGCNDCTGCNKTGLCVIDDDLNGVLARVREADYVIHSVPVYFYSMTAQMKAYLDRWCSFYDGDWKWHKHFWPDMKGKKIGLITVCGDQVTDVCESVDKIFRTLCTNSLLKFAGSIRISASARGDVNGNQDALKEAFDLGRAGCEK